MEPSESPIITLLQLQIEKYPHKVLDPQPDDICLFCLQPFRLNELGSCRAIRLEECGHIVGDQCFERWLAEKKNRCWYFGHRLRNQHTPRFLRQRYLLEESYYFAQQLKSTNDPPRYHEDKLMAGLEKAYTRVVLHGPQTYARFKVASAAIRQNRVTTKNRLEIQQLIVHIMAGSYMAKHLACFIIYGVLLYTYMKAWDLALYKGPWGWLAIPYIVLAGRIWEIPGTPIGSDEYHWIFRQPFAMWCVIVKRAVEDEALLIRYFRHLDTVLNWADEEKASLSWPLR